MHETTLTTTIAIRAGIDDAGGRKPSSTAPTAKPNADTSSPFASTGTARPRKIASRFAGVASSGESVAIQRSFAIVIVIA